MVCGTKEPQRLVGRYGGSPCPSRWARPARAVAWGIVVDRKIALVTSANFTEAAQDRNIEAGVLIQNAHFSGRLQGYLESLIERDVLKRVI